MAGDDLTLARLQDVAGRRGEDLNVVSLTDEVLVDLLLQRLEEGERNSEMVDELVKVEENLLNAME